jgi:mRNA interferase HigB
MCLSMRIVSQRSLARFSARHPDALFGLARWAELMGAADWRTTLEAVQAMGGAKALNGERVRFAIHGGHYRLVASFNFRAQVVYVKFIGTHAEYDRIDALTVSQF